MPLLRGRFSTRAPALALVLLLVGVAEAKQPTAQCVPVCDPGFVPECIAVSPSPTPTASSTPIPSPTGAPTATPAPPTATPTILATTPTPIVDTIKPTVKILSPLSGAVVPAGSLQVTAEATDNVGVAGVRFYHNGTLVGTKNVAPWIFTYQNVQPPAATLWAESYDAAGNTALHEVNVSVVANFTPTPSPAPTSTPAPTAAPSSTPTAGPSPTVAPTSPPTAGDPEAPRAVTDTTLPAVTGIVRTVLAGGNLQAALDAANPGDVVELQAGATFSGNYLLRVKPVVMPSLAARTLNVLAGTTTLPLKVWIRSTGYAQLPPPGTRAGIESAGAMAKLVSPAAPNNLPTLATIGAASNYYVTGLELASGFNSQSGTQTQIVALGFQDAQGFNGGATTAAQLPDQIVFDRVWIHGTDAGNVRRGITANTRAFAVVDSSVNEIHEVGADNQAVGWWNATGPSLIRNSWLEASCENFMAGGADTKIPNNTPADLTFEGNLVTKPARWRVGDPAYAGIQWSVKNLFELKHQKRARIRFNTFDGWWPAGQAAAIQFTVRNQDGTNPWATVEDVEFSHNRIGQNIAGSMMNFLAHDSPGSGGGVSQTMTRVLVAQNLFDYVEGFTFQVLGGPIDLRIRHNTVLLKDNVGTALSLDGSPQATRLVYENNLAGPGQYFIFGNNVGVGDAAINAYAPDLRLVGNAWFGPWPTNGGAAPSHISGHPGNFFPANRNTVGFVDLANRNYRLASSSPLKGKATDGTDVGVTDWSTIP